MEIFRLFDRLLERATFWTLQNVKKILTSATWAGKPRFEVYLSQAKSYNRPKEYLEKRIDVQKLLRSRLGTAWAFEDHQGFTRDPQLQTVFQTDKIHSNPFARRSLWKKTGAPALEPKSGRFGQGTT